MDAIPPSLWCAPHHWPQHAKDVFSAIANPLEWASRLVRHRFLPELNEHNIYSYFYRDMRILRPLWAIADHATPVPARTWKRAYKVRDAVWPVFKAVERLFLDADFPWTAAQKLPYLEVARKELLRLRSTLHEEQLIFALRKAIEKDMNQLTRAPTKSGGKRRGAPVTTDPKADKRLCDDWKAAKRQHVKRKEFARARGITVNDIIAAQDRVRYRRRRDAENACQGQ